MSLDLYTTQIESSQGAKPIVAYTHAYSHRQAVRNFCVRFSYPPFNFDGVRNERTGEVLTYQDYLNLERKR